MLLWNAPLTVALPGELWLVAGALVWPAGAWALAAARGVAGRARSRLFGRTAVSATLVAVAFLATAFLLFTTNGTTRGFQALAAQLAAGASLAGGLLCAVVAAALRRGTPPRPRSGRRSGRPRADEPPPDGRIREPGAPPTDR